MPDGIRDSRRTTLRPTLCTRRERRAQEIVLAKTVAQSKVAEEAGGWYLHPKVRHTLDTPWLRVNSDLTDASVNQL